jgi:hypothetical protein
VQIFSPLPNVLASMLNTMETIGIIPELRFQSDVNLVRLQAFVVEKTDANALVRLHR